MSTLTEVLLALGGLGWLAGLITGIASLIKARSSAKKSDLDALRLIIDELKAENIRLGTRIKCLEDEKENLIKQVQSLQDENAGHTQEIQSLRKQNEKLRERIKLLEQENHSLVGKNEGAHK